MKRIISTVMLAVICFLTFNSFAVGDDVTMYSRDGREIRVAAADAEAYKSVGWYEKKSDVQRTLYAPDGRETVVFYAEVEAYKNVGWYENKSDVQRTLYAPDGREIVVFYAEVEAYKNVGWYENKSDVQRTLYAPDGREIVVFYAEVEAYKNVGWYENKSDVQKTMYSLDGREITVFLSEVEAYKNVGWYEEKLKLSGTVDPSKPMIAITFDDGPKAATTPVVLDVLEMYGARATFFVQGVNAQNNPGILRRMDSLGCQIASHTYNHPDLTTLSDENVSYQVSTTDRIIKNILGYSPTVLRPPYGSHNQRVRNIAGKPFVLWSVDTLDWKYRSASYVSDYVLRHASDGAVILLHDIHASTVQAAKTFIPELIRRGYQLVTIDELATYKGYTLASGKSYYSFK